MKLSEEQKYFIVQRLAQWKSPTEVVELVVEEWPEAKGKIDRRQVWEYDATGSRCMAAKKWQDLFWELRQKFRDAADEIAIGQLSFRLQELSHLLEKAKRSKNLAEARACLEQAAKEVGGMFTNKRVLSGALGVVDLSSASDEQLDAILEGADPEAVLARK